MGQPVKCCFMKSNFPINQQEYSTSTCRLSNSNRWSNDQQNDEEWSHNTFGSSGLLFFDDQEETATDYFEVINQTFQNNDDVSHSISVSCQSTEDVTSVVDNETQNHESLSSFDFDEYSSTTSDDNDNFLSHAFGSTDCIKDDTSNNESYHIQSSSFSKYLPMKTILHSVPTRTIRFGKVEVYEFHKLLPVNDRDCTTLHVFLDCNKIRKKMKQIETTVLSSPTQLLPNSAYCRFSSPRMLQTQKDDTISKHQCYLDHFTCCATPPTRPQRWLEEIPPISFGDNDDSDVVDDDDIVKCDIVKPATTLFASMSVVQAIVEGDDTNVLKSNLDTTHLLSPLKTAQIVKNLQRHLSPNHKCINSRTA